MPRVRFWLLVLFWSLAGPPALCAQEDEEDFPRGLLARYSAGDRTIERVDPDIAFVWGTSAPDPRLPQGTFQAEWSILLLNRQADTYRFHVYVNGRVRVEVDGRTVLEGATQSDGWISGEPLELGFGEKPLKVSYRKTGKTARLQLFWSSENFRLEPVPGFLLFRESGNSEFTRIERGRVLFDAHRCGRCHTSPAFAQSRESAPPAPVLTHLAAGLNERWLLKKLQHKNPEAAEAKMPVYGFTADEARAVAAFLLDSSQPVALTEAARGKTKEPETDRRAGEILFRSVGCLACHSDGEIGSQALHAGGNLSQIGEKRSAAWLNTWLSDPATLNQDHRMPMIKMSRQERRQLVLYLSGLTAKQAPGDRKASASRSPRLTGDAQLVKKGRQLVEAANCTACHRIPGVEVTKNSLPDLSQPVADWSQSCLAEQPERKKNRPVYPSIDRKAVIAYVNSRTTPLSPLSEFAAGRRVLERKNCLECHERDGAPGIVETAGRISRIDPDLRGQSQGLIPPDLTAVGDKLKDDALAEAVSGDQKTGRLPWLMVRMPKFRHTAKEKSALLAYLIGHDRIPEDAPQSENFADTGVTDEEQRLVVGQTLVGARGFSCVACHRIGEYTPRNVALGTRGSDLLMLGKRMRKSYYERWTAAPLRIVPGMEMPSLQKAVPGVLDGNINRQLTATWEVLNDPRFKAPTDPASVEQFLIVKPGEPARIVRDVFTNPEENGGGYVPRALAIGFHNGHNVIFDLDTFSLRGWFFGEFARQRTEGKSWYWDMAGIPVMTGFDRTSDFALKPASHPDSKPLLPKLEQGTNGRLDNYRPHGDGLEFAYTVNFPLGDRVESISVREIIQPLTTADAEAIGRTGWQRRIAVAGLPDGYDAWLAHPKQSGGIGAPEIRAADGTRETFFAEHNRNYLWIDGGRSKNAITLLYLCSLKPEPSQADLKPTVEQLQPEPVTTVPGFDGVRLPVTRSIMPTAITWTHDGRLAFTSLKGHVYFADDTDGDGVEDSLTVFEEGLAAPYGILADGEDLIISHKPELLRLRDTDGDGRADFREVVATGWGYNDNYHDWTCGIVRDRAGNMYVGLGSDYAQKNRPEENSRWRGKILRISPRGEVTPIAASFRYPTGLAMNAAGDLFATDNQGVQNTFNEINHIVEGRHYGVPSRYEPDPEAKHYSPAIQVPHPWTRSVNAIGFLPHRPEFAPFADHGIGCEFNGRFLIRFTLQHVDGVMQGATYYFSRPNGPLGEHNFVGPICIAVSPENEIYIGSLFDSGWLGGRNTGAITKLTRNGKLPNGIRELRATPEGFEIEFLETINRQAAADPENYTISGYTRIWQGSYATPDSDRHKVTVKAAEVSANGKTVRLRVDRLKEGYVYEVTCGRIGTDPETNLWPATGHYTLHKRPR